jgi:hypothetical protein
MGYNSTGNPVIFTAAGKAFFIKLLYCLGKNDPVEVRDVERERGFVGWREFLRATHWGSGSILSLLTGTINTQAKQCVFECLVPAKTFVLPRDLPKTSSFLGGLWYEAAYLIETIFDQGVTNERAAAESSLDDAFFSDLECTIFEEFAKHYRAAEFIGGISRQGWVDWEEQCEIVFQGEDDERWGYRWESARSPDDGEGERRLVYVNYEKDMGGEEPEEFEEGDTAHEARGACENCEENCVAESEGRAKSNSMCPLCAWEEDPEHTETSRTPAPDDGTESSMDVRASVDRFLEAVERL